MDAAHTYRYILLAHTGRTRRAAGFSTRERFGPPLSHDYSALLTCRLSPRLLGGSSRVVPARLVIRGASMARAGALAAGRRPRAR
jgi:hypothetical protein